MSDEDIDDDWIVPDLPFRFPIITIPTPNPEKWWELVNIHFKWDVFTNLSRDELKSREEVGRVVMDFDGRSWRIVDMIAEKHKTDGPWNAFWTMVFGNRRARYQLSDELGLSLDEIKDLALGVIRANPGGWRDDEAIAGEGGIMPLDEDKALDDFLSKVAAARSPLELMAALDFEGRDS